MDFIFCLQKTFQASYGKDPMLVETQHMPITGKDCAPFGVTEALLSDRGANLLSHHMEDVCSLMGITKLNMTAYHPQCNGMVE